MGNLLQKTIASALCLSFFMTQATFANLPTTGDVLKDAGTGGANIKDATEGFTGFQNGGLFGLNKNEATLNFKGDAVINWNRLNVGGNQSLTFKNVGNPNVVLNNVLEGMSTFAGMVKGENVGHIIISNPNGILVEGGRFETSGALTLTTKNLSGLKDTDLRDNLEDKIEHAEYTNDYAVIVFKEGKANVFTPAQNANIKAGEINIIAKGINVSNADLFAKNGNIVFKTSNGADFVASTTNKKFDAEKANKTFDTNFKDGNTIQVANASIKTPTGTIQFVTKDTGNISVASVKTPNSYSFKTENGNVSIVSANNSVKIANSNINGNLNVKGKLDVPSSWDDLWNLFKGNSDVLGDIEITDSKITGTSTLQTLGNIVIENCEKIGNLVAESTFRGIKVGNSDIKGNADFKVTGKTYDIIPYYNIKEGKKIDSVYVAPKGGVVASNTNIGGTINLNVKNNAQFSSPEGATLNFVNPNVGGKLIATADNISFKKDGGLTINDAFNAKYKLNATDELSFKTDGDLIANSNNIGFGSANSTKFEGKNVNLKDITTNAINVIAKNGKIVAENVTAKAKDISNNIVARFEGKKVISENSNYQGEIFVNASNNATFESNNNLTFAKGSSVANQFKANSDKDITINDMTCNNIQAKGKNVTLNKSSNLAINKNNINLVASEDVNVNADGILNVIESTIEGNNINLNANEIASTDAIYAGNVKMDSKGGITFNKDNSIAGTLTAKANNDIDFKGVTIADKDITVNTKSNAIVHNVEVKNGTLAINNARNISVNNCSADKLAIVNTPNNKFDYAEIYNTYAGTTEFGHGKYLYIDLTQSNLYRNNIKAILDNAYNVDKIVFNPMSAIYGQESSKNMNNLRAKGINVNIDQSFTPIAFAANEDAKNSKLFKVAGDKVFKDLEKVVHITDKFILD